MLKFLQKLVLATLALTGVGAMAQSYTIPNTASSPTWLGTHTFNIPPLIPTQPTSANQAANKAYVDSKVTGLIPSSPTNAIPFISGSSTWGTSTQFSIDPNTFFLYTRGLQGWHPQGGFGLTTAPNENRDNLLNALGSAIPDYGGAGLGTNENGDECAMVQQQIFQAQSFTAGPPKVVHTHGAYIRCTGPNYLMLMNRDFGDYLATSQGSGATVTTYQDVVGQINRCAVQGGGGYNANATLPVGFLDLQQRGSGAAAHVTTNSSGVPNGCFVDLVGMNYPVDNIIATVYPIGADGATATTTLTAGTFALTWTATTQGNGYTTAPAGSMPFYPGQVSCTANPTIVVTVDGSGHVTGGTSTAGSGCTYQGSSNASNVPICIGACAEGLQATNLAPETPTVLAVSIALFPNVILDCDGGTIEADWLGDVPNGPIVLGDPYGYNGQHIEVRNCNLSGLVDIAFAGPTQDVYIHDNVFEAVPWGGTPGSMALGNGASIGVLFMGGAGPNTVLARNGENGNTGWYCGGIWDSRTGHQGGLGSYGGLDISQKNTVVNCSGLTVRDGSMYPSAGNNNGVFGQVDLRLPPSLNGNRNQYNLPLDQWAATILWKQQDGPTLNPYAPNGTAACPVLNTIADRTTDYKFGVQNTTNAATFPFFACFRGPSDIWGDMLSRNGVTSQVTIEGFTNYIGAGRPAIIGTLDDSTIVDVNTTTGLTYTDPELPSGVKQEGVVAIQCAATCFNFISGVTLMPPGNAPNFGLGFSGMVGVTTGGATDYSGTFWTGISSVNSQSRVNIPTFTYPGITVSGHINQGAANNFADVCTMASGTCTATTFVTPYTSTPVCTCSWTGTGTLTGLIKCAHTTSTITPASSVNTDTAQIGWSCHGNLN